MKERDVFSGKRVLEAEILVHLRWAVPLPGVLLRRGRSFCAGRTLARGPSPPPDRISYPSCSPPSTHGRWQFSCHSPTSSPPRSQIGDSEGPCPGSLQHGQRCQVPGTGPAAPFPQEDESQLDVTCEGGAGICWVTPRQQVLPKPELVAPRLPHELYKKLLP